MIVVAKQVISHSYNNLVWWTVDRVEQWTVDRVEKTSLVQKVACAYYYLYGRGCSSTMSLFSEVIKIKQEIKVNNEEEQKCAHSNAKQYSPQAEVIAESVKYMLYKYEFDPQHPHENLGVLAHISRMVETGGSLELIRQSDQDNE